MQGKLLLSLTGLAIEAAYAAGLCKLRSSSIETCSSIETVLSISATSAGVSGLSTTATFVPSDTTTTLTTSFITTTPDMTSSSSSTITTNEATTVVDATDSITSSSATTSSTRTLPTTVNTGGFATFFYQDGEQGACGNINKDTDLIVTLPDSWYGADTTDPSPYCGASIRVTNTDNGLSVDVVVAGVCLTCVNANSINLSVAAFSTIADQADGQVPISWYFT